MTPSIRHRNGVITIDNTPLQSGAIQETYLTAEGTSGSSTITVRNIAGFAIDQILLIEPLGSENAEIIKTHASTPPSGSTVTLASNLARTHAVNAKVYVIAYDRFRLEYATTAAGSKSDITTTLGTGLVAVQPDVRLQRFELASADTARAYFFARYNDSISSTYSNYSGALPNGGWDRDTVGYVIERALREAGVQSLSDKVTKEDCYAWLAECFREIEGKQLRWPEHFSYNAVLGQTTRGINTVTMPADAYDTESNRSLVRVRIGTDGDDLAYYSPDQFDEQMNSAVSTTVRTQASANDTSLEIDNSYDFADSGTVNVYISGTLHAISYTGVTRSASAGVLTGIPASGDGSITVTIPVDTNVWQNELEGQPRIWTVRNGNIEYYPLPSDTYDNQNVYGDYAKVVTEIDSDDDTIDFHRYDMCLNYLAWRIRMKLKNDGKLDQTDGLYLIFKAKLTDAIRTAPRGMNYKRSYRPNRMLRR